MKTVRLLALFALLALCSLARADVPRTIAFQGTLKDVAGTPVTGPRQVTFTLYDSATEGTSLWAETQTVTATNGLFAAPLGSVTPLNLPFDKPYWVGIKVGDDAEMTPRVPLMSAPYALALPWITAKDRKVGINSSNPDNALTIAPSGIGDWVSLKDGSGATKWHLSDWGGGINIAETNVADGRLFLARGGSVGVGTTDPQTKLDVRGNLFATGKVHRLSLAANGGGQIILANNPSDNRVYIEGATADGSGNAAEILITGNGATSLPDFSVWADRTHLRGTLEVGGSASCTTLTLTSSHRFKRDVQPLTNALGTLSQLQGVSYVWDQQHGGKADIGFIAEDAGKVVPELVTWEPNGVDAVGMDYSHLTALTVEGIKEQQAEIESLKAESAAKDARIAGLEARLARLERLVEGKR